MNTSADDVHVAMHDVSGAAAPAGIPFDTSNVWVQKDQWPSFDNWEYTVIFHQNLQGPQLEGFREFLGLVEKTGLVAQLYKSPANEKQFILKLRAAQSWYDERATKLHYLYELKPILCEVPEEAQDLVAKKLQREDKEPTHRPIIKRMYEPFDVDEKENFMFEGYHNMYTSFRGAMIEYFLRERRVDGGCEMAKFVQRNVVANFFPNHEPDRVTWFQSNWMLSMPWKDAPIDEIRNYFGEKIAFYFAWLSHFTNWLIAPGILGLCIAFFLVSRKIEEVNRSIVGPIFGVLLMVYMTCYLEFWKRRSASLAFRWGVTDFNKKEPDRPEYEATELDFNFFTQETVMYYPKKDRLKKQLVGVPAVLFTIAAACTVMVIILMWKYVQFWLGPDQQKDPFGPWKLVVPSLCNTAAIIVFSKVHRILAVRLNDWENYQTQTEYETQLIRKVFFFEFVNNFTGLLYTAFALGDILSMYQLYFAILVQMVIMQFVGNITALAQPQVELFLNRRKQNQGTKLAWSDVLAGNDPYDTFGDFNEIVIQFGYVMFFSAAFPAAAFLSWVNNVMEIRLDAYSILHCEPRPSSERAGGIGVWFEIIELMSFLAIVINALIFALTSNAIGAGIHNFCQFEFKDIDVTTSPYGLASMSWVQQGCVGFCSGMYQSQTFHNPTIRLSPCGTLPLINPSTKQPYSSCRTVPSVQAVECSAQSPCPGREGPDGVGSNTNQCDSPFLCNPVPLAVPVQSPRSLLGKNGNADWSRAYCQESPRVNMGTGEWRFEKPTQFYAWNPFLNNFPASPPPQPSPTNPLVNTPAYRSVETYEYGMVSCSLICDNKGNCPYSRDNPTFNPKLQREVAFKPMDYISPATLKAIQDKSEVKCLKRNNQYGPPEGEPYCFLCPSVDLQLTQLVVGADFYNEIVFTTSFGPTVAVLWSILVFEHVIFMIKFVVMAVIPDVTSDIEEQLTGHDTYRHRLAMARRPHHAHHSSGQGQSTLVEKAANAQQLPEDDDLWNPRTLTLDILHNALAQKTQVRYRKPGDDSHGQAMADEATMRLQ